MQLKNFAKFLEKNKRNLCLDSDCSYLNQCQRCHLISLIMYSKNSNLQFKHFQNSPWRTHFNELYFKHFQGEQMESECSCCILM